MSNAYFLFFVICIHDIRLLRFFLAYYSTISRARYGFTETYRDIAFED